MRANRVTVRDVDAYSRRAVTSIVEREKEQRRLEAVKKPEEPKPGPPDSFEMKDASGKVWKVTLDAKGEFVKAPVVAAPAEPPPPVVEPKDASPPPGK